MQTLVVGLGRAGAGLHVPVLAKARSLAPDLFGDEPVVGCDPGRPVPANPRLTVARDLDHARRLVEPKDTVVHVCTPPDVRTAVVAELAAHGFRRFVVEKPLAPDTDELARMQRLIRKHRLRLEVVEPWLASTLTHRLTEVVRDNEFGELRAITIEQDKPRFRRSLSGSAGQNAFDVELPHGVGLALRLAGNARVTHATGYDLVLDDLVVPRMGGAEVGLRHTSGVRSRITSDLTSPIRQRRVTCEFTHGTAVGHYPVSEDDDHAQLTLTRNGRTEHAVLRDDCLLSWMIGAYRGFWRGVASPARGMLGSSEVVRILSVAKNVCAEPITGGRVPRYAG
ncbi:putative dehydrogenase [Amycolatopsis sulphurea]|uniref:Putative dehydrogenase n=1 Tax=Amycolatopsis sulphurea TaxID=76022 RepID=A0A2A9G1X4_9PSEU|nr:Gfo/Idh/MocA family oxidoreductase [Amycolatopsis sulphurea]PFG56745.1 putative dehydrogenase [Amycolatopsis sulphurea]